MLRARKHKKVFMAKVSNQKPEAEFCQHPAASPVASQVPCEPKHPLPKRIWKPKQKSPAETSGVTMPKPRLSHEEKGKMPFCSNNAANHKVKTAIIPSLNSRVAMPCASLVFTSEATVPQHTHWVHGREARAKVLSKANPLRIGIAGKAPQCAPLPSSSSSKHASAGEVRTKALFSANLFCRDKRNDASSYAHSERVSTRDYPGPGVPDLRELLANMRKLEPLRTAPPCC